MKGGQPLTEKINPIWQKYNIEYHHLKQQFKLKSGDKWKIKDEETFKNLLEKEIDKVCHFLQLQITQLFQHLQSFESSSSSICTNQKEKEKGQAKITTIIFNTHDLANYLYRNKVGLEEVVRKHDYYCSQFTLKHYYDQHIHNQLQSYQQQLDYLYLRLSQLYDLYRSSPTPPSMSSSMSSSSVDKKKENTCNTYWVHPDHINELKAILLFYLPMALPSSSQQDDHHHLNNRVNTVYFDNIHMDLYKEKIKLCNHHQYHNIEESKEEDDKKLLLLKCQWYNDHLSEMYIEHQEQQQKKNQLIKKSYTMDGTTLPTFSYHDLHTTAMNHHHPHEFFDWIQQKKLIPQCQTTCQRTIYHQKETNLSIYLDTNIQFFEMMSSSPSSSSSSSSWQQQQLQSSSSLFDYGVLTILNTTDNELPYWLKEILSSHLVYPVPRFSFYIHAQSLLYTNQLPLHPWWLTIKEMDLLNKKKQKDYPPPSPSPYPSTAIGLSRSFITLQPYINGHRPHSIITFNEDDHLHHREKEEGKGKALFYQFKAWIKEKCNRMNQQKNKTFVFRNNKLTEPKTHFANERTFITWLQLCAIFMTISLSLLNHGDWVSRSMGSMLIFICCLLSIYALGRFQYRSWQLRTRKYVVRYDDVLGPTFLCLTLILAMAMNIYYRYPLIIEAIQSL